MSDFTIQVALGARWRIVHLARLQRDGHKVLIHTPDDIGIGENHLTGGSREHSAAFIVDRAIDEYPQQDWFVFAARSVQGVEQTCFPCDFPRIVTKVVKPAKAKPSTIAIEIPITLNPK